MAIGLSWLIPLVAVAHGSTEVREAPAALAVHGAAPTVPEGTSELRFNELFRLPVGPRGLEPSARLRTLDGRHVRMVGYMAEAEQPVPGRLVLVPLPVNLGDEDEHLADDLPPSAVFVHLAGPAAVGELPNYRGLLRLEGVLSVGPLTEADGRISLVRLRLDEATSALLLPPTAPPHPSASHP